MPFFSIRHRTNSSRRSRKSRPSSLPAEPPPSDQASFLVRFDPLPSRSPTGHALDYYTYTPSQYYHPPKQHAPRRPRLPSLTDPSTDSISDSHLTSSSSTNPAPRRQRTQSTTSAAAATAAAVSAAAHPLTVSHAIRLKVAHLRRHMGRAHQLGDFTLLREAVVHHRATLATLSERRAALTRLFRDACLVAGLPPPTALEIPPVASTSTTTALSSTSPSPSFTHTSASIAGSSSRVGERVLVPSSPPTPPSPPPSPSTTTPAPPPRRRVAAIRNLGGRTLSVLKARAWTSRSSSNTLLALEEPTRPNRKSTAVSSPDPSPPVLGDDPDLPPMATSVQERGPVPTSRFTPGGSGGSVSRKSSGRLRRFGSTGTVFLKRFTRAPPSTSPKTVLNSRHGGGDVDGAEGNVITPPPTISTPFDQQTLTRLATDPAPLLEEYRAALTQLRADESAAQVALSTADQKLEQRRHEHRMAMSILDHFYGAQPGWQDDPIAVHMFTETVDMTEAGLQAERDLVDARGLAAQALAAASDTELSHVSLQRAGVSVAGFADALESFANNLGDGDTDVKRRGRGGGDGRNNGVERNGEEGTVRSDVALALRELEMRLDRAVRATEVAVSCCVDAPRVAQLTKDLVKLREGFVGEVRAVGTLGRVYRKDMTGMISVARSAVVDCKLAEAFVRERMRLIAEDVAQFNATVEKCEEYVMMERMTLVDLHYPEREEGRVWRGLDVD